MDSKGQDLDWLRAVWDKAVSQQKTEIKFIWGCAKAIFQFKIKLFPKVEFDYK